MSIYDIEDANEDKATVPIDCESRLAKLDIDREAIDRLNKDVEEVIEAEEASRTSNFGQLNIEGKRIENGNNLWAALLRRSMGKAGGGCPSLFDLRNRSNGL